MRLASSALLCLLTIAGPDDAGWMELAGPNGLKAWKEPTGAWADVGAVKPDPKNERFLADEPGSGVLFNGRLGRTRNLVSRESFGDVELHLEFLVPKGSNAGVKLQGLYEVQIFDSWGVEKPTGSDCGGVYPRAELLPTYHHIDEGFPPKVNACKPPGEWQTLELTFRAPRFDASGKKLANARFDKVLLNGQVVQEGLEVPTPTGHAYRNRELARGPIFLQADHGPFAVRSVKVRPLPSEAR